METNYKIIGGDGQEYGPVTLEELKNWVRDGRVGSPTQIWRSDLGSWKPAGQYEELQSELALAPPLPAGIGAEIERVGFWPRLAGHILDQLVLGVIVYAIVGWPHASQFDPAKGFNYVPILKQSGANFLFSLIYYTFLTGRFGATLGKMAISAKVVRVDGSPIGYVKALVRFLASILSSLICGIGYLMVAFRDDKRALHDLLADTQVIYKR
ncbi:MAG: RDD family protein [Verrucomicrobiota bacterium]|nr:RDD family protein [Verrucomicrobiota bacterium]